MRHFIPQFKFKIKPILHKNLMQHAVTALLAFINRHVEYFECFGMRNGALKLQPGQRLHRKGHENENFCGKYMRKTKS